MSGYESVGEVIHIAVAKNNKDIVIRCDFMKIEKWTFIFCLLVFIATNILKQVKGKKRETIVGITTSNYQETTDTTLQEKEFKRCCIWQNVKFALLIIGLIAVIIRAYIFYF